MPTFTANVVGATIASKLPNSIQPTLVLQNKSLFVKGQSISVAGPNIAAIDAAVVTKAVTPTFSQVASTDREFWG